MTQGDPNVPPPMVPPTPDYAPAEPRGLFSPPPVPTFETTKDDRTWGMLCHLAAFAGFIIPLGTFLGPLVVWLIKKNESRFVDDQGKESLNFHISVLILALILAPTICIGIGIFLLPALGLVALIFVIIASVKANEGVAYRYPFAIRLIK